MNLHRMAVVAALAVSWPARAQTVAPDTEVRVKLLAPLSTETNRKGDKITAQVVSPQQFAGDIMEGEVRESKSGGKVRGKSILNFTFHTLNHGGNAVPVDSQIKALINSRGQQNVDEEGRVVEKKSNVGKAVAGAGVGAVIGGIVGGAKGAAIGAGVGGAASLILIQTTARGANITFAPGSEIVLAISERRKS